MNDLPPEILSHLVSYCNCVQTLVAARRVSRAFKKAVATLAPVERVPDLLASSSFEPIESATVLELFPSLRSLYHRVFGGKWTDVVWKSRLVQYLARSDDLDNLPWKEVIFHRIVPDRKHLFPPESPVYKPEFVSDAGKLRWCLPNAEQSPFRLSSWMKAIDYFSDSNNVFDTPWLWQSDTVTQFQAEVEEFSKLVFKRYRIPQHRREVRMWDFRPVKSRPGLYNGDWTIVHFEIGPYFFVVFMFDPEV